MRCPACGHINITHFGFCEECLSLLEVESREARALRGEPSFAEEDLLAAPRGPDSTGLLHKQLPWLPAGTVEPYMHEGAVRDLASAFRRAAAEGRCEQVLVIGDPGMGKTRLLRELLSSVSSTPKYLFLADARDDALAPLALFRSLLRTRYQIAADLDPLEAAERLHEEIVQLHEASDPVQDAHLVGFLVGMSVRSTPFLRVAPDEREGLRFSAMQALTRLLIRDARHRTLMIVIDEAHLASAESRHVLAHLHRSLEGHSVWFVLAGRPGLLESTTEFSEAEHQVSLSALTRRSMIRLVQELLTGLPQVPSDIVERVAETAGGNPYAAYHVLLFLHETGTITREKGRWAIDETAFFDLAIPSTLAGVAAARYQRLSVEEKAVLTRAAVVGQRFRLGSVLALDRAEKGTGRPGGPAAPPPADVQRTRGLLEELVRKAFLRPCVETLVPGEECFQFSSEVERDLLSSALRPGQLQHMHEIVAEWYAVNLPPDAPVRHEILAHHFEEAGNPSRAGFHALRAGQIAAVGFQNRRAIELLERARRLLGRAQVSLLVQVNHDLGNVYTRVGDPDQALARLEEMLDLAWRMRARSKGAAALDKLARVHRELGAYEESLRLALRALELFRQVGDRRGLASACDEVGQAFWLLGDFQRALGYFQQEIRIRRDLEDERGLGVALTNVAKVYADRGDLDRARRFATRAYDIFRKVADPVGVITTLNLQAVCAFYLGEIDRARELLTAALDEARSIGHRALEAKVLSNLGEILLGSDSDRARDLVVSSLDLAERLSDPRVAAAARFTLARLHARTGSWKDALVVVRRGLSDVRTTQNRLMVAQGQMHVAEILLGQGRALGSASTDGSRGPVAEAISLLESAVAALESMGARWHLAQALGSLSAAFDQAGRGDDARVVQDRLADLRIQLEPRGGSQGSEAESPPSE